MQKRLEYKGIELIYWDRGEGPCLVLLHGYLESSEIWDSFANSIPQGYRLIIPDLPVKGNSWTLGAIHTMDDLADDVMTIVDAEGITKIFLVGHSM